jgi:hypothetical protein
VVGSGHDQTGSSRSSTSTPEVMPIPGSRLVGSEHVHAATGCRQRISPSRSP